MFSYCGYCKVNICIVLGKVIKYVIYTGLPTKDDTIETIEGNIWLIY